MGDIFEPINFYETTTKHNSIYDFDILEEKAKSDRKGTESQFIRLFNHMIKYQYQQNLQSPSWIKTMVDASNELLTRYSGKSSLWNTITREVLDSYYIVARGITIDDCKVYAEKSRLENVISSHIPANFTKENCINYDFIKGFCIDYENHNLPEMERYIAGMK